MLPEHIVITNKGSAKALREREFLSEREHNILNNIVVRTAFSWSFEVSVAVNGLQDLYIPKSFNRTC